MKALELLPNKRSLAFSLVILVLFSVFFGGYFYYYIPANRQNLHRNAFLILENIRNNIQGRNQDLQRLYNTFYNERNKTTGDEQPPEAVMQRLLDSNRVAGKALADPRLFRGLPPDTTAALRHAADGDYDHQVRLDSIGGNRLFYLPYQARRQEQVAIELPVDNILRPILQTQRAELIPSYALVRVRDNKGTLVYKDSSLGIRADIPIDSLLPGKKNPFVAGLRDLRIEEEDYKVFYYPFELENQHLLLCGFVPKQAYDTQLNEIPVSFIYPLLILFLLLLIALPIIKLVIMGSEEQVRLADLFSLGLSFFGGATMVTFIVIQLLLYLGATERARHDLDALANQLQQAFEHETTSTVRQLDGMDAFIRDSLDARGSAPADNINASALIGRYLARHAGDALVNNPFDRVVWIDSAGRQRIKAQVDQGNPLFTDVSRRRYFQRFREGEPFLLPGDGRFALEPVYSWTNGEFRMITSRETKVPGLFIASLSTQMFPLTQALLPAGYGFCIIDEQGSVQMHADPSRNLQENFFDKLEAPRPLQESVTSRQSNFFPDMRFYGKRQALYIRPLNGVPLYLITYYDTGYVVPVNMRIFSFALLFCIIFYVVCGFIWLVALRRRSAEYPMVFSPMAYLKWIVPRQKAAPFYIHFSILLGIYIALVLLSIFVANQLQVNHYVILMIVLITPVNIAVALFAVNYATSNALAGLPGASAGALARRRAIQAVAWHAVISVLVYGYAYFFGYPIDWHFFLFQGGYHALLWLYLQNQRRLSVMFTVHRWSYLTHYSVLMMLLIVCLGIIPPALNTWYAHNQEITQSVKKQQLHLARGIERRIGDVNRQFPPGTALYLPPEYFDSLVYRSGIYQPYATRVSAATKYESGTSHLKSFEEFYFRIADYISYSAYDPQHYPALQDTASDNAWAWSNRDSSLALVYQPGISQQGRVSAQPGPGNALEIVTRVPPRYIYLKPDIRGFWLLVLIGSLLAGMYLVLRMLVEKIFLKKFIVTAGSNTPANAWQQLVTAYQADPDNAAKPPVEVPDPTEEEKKYRPGGSKERIFMQEKDILNAIARYDAFYTYTWEKCTDKEKYLLFDFAGDGFVNFKNVSELYHLLDRGILVVRDEALKLFASSFRTFVLCKKHSPIMYELQKKYRANSTWQGFRIPLLVLLLGTAGFIFFTQEESFQKFMGLVAGVSTMLSLLVKFFADGGKTAIPKVEPKT